MFRRTSLALGLVAVLVAVACGGGSTPTAGSASSGGSKSSEKSKLAFAACSDAASECESGVRDDGHRACSVTCASDSDCPAEPKSGVPKCKTGVCESERADVDCEHAGETGGSTGAGGEGGAGTGGSAGNEDGGRASGSGGEASGSGGEASGSGGEASDGGGTGATGGSASTGAGGKSGGTIGVGDACSSDEQCISGICYRPGGPPGFCTATCTQSFDVTCVGTGPDGQNSTNENVYCMPFASGGRCYPGCVNSKSCPLYAGTVCTDTMDLKGYRGQVCVERL